MSYIAAKAAKKILAGRVAQYEPEDPHYIIEVDERGKKKKRKRPVPPGLSKRDEKALVKIRKRAHYLDKGMNLCGFRVGWTFFIGFIPIAGDVANATLNHNLVVKPSKKLDIPDWLVHKMLFNNAISAGVGFVPLVGDVALAVWKANSRNAHLLEEFLTIRGAEFLAQNGLDQATTGSGAATPAIPPRTANTGRPIADHVVDGQTVPAEHVQAEFGAGKGMEPGEAKSKGWFARK